MQVTIKTLQQEVFKVEVEASDSVSYAFTTYGYCVNLAHVFLVLVNLC